MSRATSWIADWEEGSSRRAVDGLLVNQAEVWVVIASQDENPFDLLLDPGDESHPALKICRGVIDGNTLIIGDVDPEQDHLLSDLLQTDRCGHA